MTWADPLSAAEVEEIRAAATATWEKLATEGGEKALAYLATILDLLAK